MRKLFLALFAILFVVGVASAANIPSMVDPKTDREVWLMSVYNDEGSTMSAGQCAEWKMDSGTDDNEAYVELCDSVDTFLVAGIVFPANILAGERGTIAIKGPVPATTVSTIPAGALLCSSATAGSLAVCSDMTSDPNAIGFTTTTGSAGSTTVNVILK